MGLQDRDYYREIHEKNDSPFSIQSTRRKEPSIKYLLYPVVTIGALWYGGDVLLKIRELNNITAPPGQLNYPQPISGGITLKTDRQGHFRGTVFINNVPMPFLIDTGATKTVIPTNLAAAARLPVGRMVQTNTAGGKVAAHETRINNFKIGNAIIRNLDAQINKHLDEVLIGMNTLKYFRITQSGNTLTLVANNQVNKILVKEPAAFIDTHEHQQLIKKTTVIKKRVICNENKICRTSYSDH